MLVPQILQNLLITLLDALHFAQHTKSSVSGSAVGVAAAATSPRKSNRNLCKI
jgi:hypothetical protein